MSFADLPVDILHIIASNSYDVCRAMLAIPAFARSLTPSIRWDYRIAFGETVEIYGRDAISICWMLNGRYHRVDGPAVTCANGLQVWYNNGECHRENGPAVVYADGTCEYWLNDIRQPDQ